MPSSRSATPTLTNSHNSRDKMSLAWAPYRLYFKFEARTSRAVMLHKDTYFLKMWHEDNPEVFGIGEVPLFIGLSKEDTPDFERVLAKLCSEDLSDVPNCSSIRFGLESARRDLAEGGKRTPWPASPFANGKPVEINGLVWMGDKRLMAERVREKLAQGFRCIKMKIGGIDFEDEYELVAALRAQFSADDLEIRLDANGAFTRDNALPRLDRLSKLRIHSLEQPVKAGQPELMAEICRNSPIAIALDEELIGIDLDQAPALLEFVKPAYIILKPALCGGFHAADCLIATAESMGIGWWATSALESNIGLNAIAEWVSNYNPVMPQGLGTGELYTNNVRSPLFLDGSKLRTASIDHWQLPLLNWRQ